MATRLIVKESGGEKPAAKKAPTKKGGASKKAAANGPAASARPTPTAKARKRLPTATVRALQDLDAGEVNHDANETAPCTTSHIPNARTRKALRDAEAGKNLTSYVDADDMFKKLGIKLGKEKV